MKFALFFKTFFFPTMDLIFIYTIIIFFLMRILKKIKKNAFSQLLRNKGSKCWRLNQCILLLLTINMDFVLFFSFLLFHISSADQAEIKALNNNSLQTFKLFN